jgi:hypothetical protein
VGVRGAWDGVDATAVTSDHVVGRTSSTLSSHSFLWGLMSCRSSGRRVQMPELPGRASRIQGSRANSLGVGALEGADLCPRVREGELTRKEVLADDGLEDGRFASTLSTHRLPCEPQA